MPGIIAALIVTVCAWFLWQISEIVVLFLISLLMFYVIDPLITSIERGLKLNRTGAIMLFYLLCLIVVGLVLWLVLPVVVGQFQTVYSLLTDEAVQADFVNRANELAARSPIEVPVEELSGSISEYAAPGPVGYRSLPDRHGRSASGRLYSWTDGGGQFGRQPVGVGFSVKNIRLGL